MATEPSKDSDHPKILAQDDQISEADSAAIAAAMAEDTQPTAKSLKCVDCGKLFKNADLANYHAEKSGHENFEESVEEVLPLHRALLMKIKPLTEEEKKAKLEDLKAKMLIRKAEQAEKERKEAKANEVCSLPRGYLR